MNKATAVLLYLGAALAGLTIAFLATGLISLAIFPADGTIGEGLLMLFIFFIFSLVCVPAYIVLMTLHRRGRRDTRGSVACEVILRASVIVAACLLCFMAIKLPTTITTKFLACLLGVPAFAWAIKPTTKSEATNGRGASA